jgi:hypothetical protein
VIVWSAIHAALGLAPGELTYADVHSAVETHHLAESDELDWKRDLPTRATQQVIELAKDVAAMANTRGGLIVYGVQEYDDRSSRAEKISAVETNDHLRQMLSTHAYNQVHPLVGGLEVVGLDSPETPGHGVLVASVPASPDAPHIIGKENGLGVPWRDGPHTRWMRERELERAYRDRFERRMGEQTRLSDASTQLSEHLDIENRAWLVATAVPRSQLPALLPPATRQTVAETLRAGHTRADQLTAPNQGQRVAGLYNLDDNMILSPRVGLRRWIVQTGRVNASAAEKALCIELHHDGAVSLAQSVDGWYEWSGSDSGHGVPGRVVESTLADFVAVVDAYATRLGATGLYGLRADLIRADVARPFVALTQWSIGGHMGNLEPFEWARPVRALTPVLAELTTPAQLDELRDVARQMALDVVNQFNVGRTTLFSEPTPQTE